MILVSILKICIIITIALKSKNLTLFAVSYDVVERRQYLGDAQTKCTRHRPWCGGDIDALGLGAAGSYATLGAKAATHHGRRIFLAYSVAELGLIPYVGCYVGTVWQRETKISRVTIGFKLVTDLCVPILSMIFGNKWRES